MAGDRVEHRERRELAARQHEVAEGDLVGAQRLVDALVEPLVAPAHEQDPAERRQLARHGVVEAAAARVGEDDVGRLGTPSRTTARTAGTTAETISTIPGPPPYGSSST